MVESQADDAAPTDAALARATGIAMLALGALGVVGAIAGFAFAAPIPAPLHHANLALAVLELGLGYGVIARTRAPWSFAVTAEGVITLINVLGLPEFLRAHDWLSLGVASARGVLFVLLMLCASAITSHAPDDGA